MAKHRLIPFDLMRRRMLWRLGIFLAILLAVGLYDQFTSYLGPTWYGWWIAILLVVGMILYYAVLYRRAGIQVKPGCLRLQGPLTGYNISYGRISTVTSGKLEQHYPKEQLNRYEWSILKPLYNHTCLFIQLSSYPTSFKRRRLWFPRTLFSPNRQGLICYVDDWMALSSEVETLCANRDVKKQQSHISNRRTLVGRVLAEEMEFT